MYLFVWLWQLIQQLIHTLWFDTQSPFQIYHFKRVYIEITIDRIGKMKKRNQTIKRDQRALLWVGKVHGLYTINISVWWFVCENINLAWNKNVNRIITERKTSAETKRNMKLFAMTLLCYTGRPIEIRLGWIHRTYNLAR